VQESFVDLQNLHAIRRPLEGDVAVANVMYNFFVTVALIGLLGERGDFPEKNAEGPERMWR
jgi:hypothetical protein